MYHMALPVVHSSRSPSSTMEYALAVLCDDSDFEEWLSQQRRKRKRMRLIVDAIAAVVTGGDKGETSAEVQRSNGVEGFVTCIVPTYSDIQFKEHFRMSRTTFQALLQATAQHMREGPTQIPLETKALMTLWLLGNQESFRGVADRFGINRGTLHFVVEQMVQLWTLCMPENITWPTDLQRVANAFLMKWNFPGVVGAIDGCHILIKAPLEEQSAYYNRKEQHSMILQGCCDDTMMFTHVVIGYPGRMHDARVFVSSGVEEILGRLPEDMHVLGDSAYPLRSYLMSPFRDNGHLSPLQVRYNLRHSKARAVIGRAFGHLKAKFRRLQYLDMSRMDLILKVVGSACFLHNFVINNTDGDECDEEEAVQDEEESGSQEEEASSADVAASAKRMRIANDL
ncbi:uncharacterized protein LOC135398766 [Ornithodoros turicata]|uniref:uncharacterized protein LOC135398766 n=1 Tax=Ornithodoros turicata TaxID=34597 RepID=UPI00313A1A6B